MFRKHRIEALSDGIFAIAMTLLVLEFKVPDAAHGHLWSALQSQRVAFFCFVLTFTITARYWILQHMVFELVEHVHRQAVVLTFCFLACISLLPFTTPLIAQYGNEPVGVAIYCVNQAGIGAALAVKLEFVRVKDKLPMTPMMRGLRIKLWSITAAMAIGAVLPFFVPTKFAFWPSAAVIFIGQRLSNRYRAAAEVI